jgi:4'-phosphopantetheinyl transferase
VNVTVWRCDLDRGIASLDLLDQAERARAAAFKFDHHRRRYVAAHTFLRKVLGDALSVPPAAIRFQVTQHGKPYLADHSSVVFNMSHADGIAYVAIASAGAVGIDVELHHTIQDLMGVARTVFSTVELEELARTSGHGQTASFLRCWTRKEAYVKALGIGLGTDLPRVTVRSVAEDLVVPPAADISDAAYYVRTVDSLANEYVALSMSTYPERIVLANFN